LVFARNLILLFDELRVDIPWPSAIGGVTSDVEEGAGLLAGRTSIRGHIGFENVSTI
jgi:hypothetical protein